MTTYAALYSICYRTSMMLDMETCFIARHSNQQNWTILEGHGVLNSPNIFSLTPHPSTLDRTFHEYQSPCELRFLAPFNTRITFEYLAYQGADIVLFCGSRQHQSKMTSPEIKFFQSQYRLATQVLADIRPWPTSLGTRRH